MRRARSPCRNRGTVWITRVSTNHEAAFRPEWSFLHLFHMFGIDGFRFVKMEGLSRFGTVRKIFLPPASHQMLAHHFAHTQHCQKVVCLAIQSNAADDIAPGAEPREW